MARDERVHQLMQHDKMVKNTADPVPNETPGADTPPVPTGPQMLMNVLT